MFSAPEQLSAATKANVEARLAVISAFTSKAFEGLGKVIDLNINTVKNSLAESAEAARQLLTAQSPQEFFSLATQTQTNLDKLLAYGRLFADISSSTQAELLKVTREQLTDYNDATTQKLTKPAPKKAPSASLGDAANAPKPATPEAKPVKKAAKTVKVASEPTTIAPAPSKVAATAKAKAPVNKSKPVVAPEAKPVVEKAQVKSAAPAAKPAAEKAPEKLAAPVQVQATATARKTAEDKPATKPVAASAATTVAKPDLPTAQATVVSDKNIPKKK